METQHKNTIFLKILEFGFCSKFTQNYNLIRDLITAHAAGKKNNGNN